MIVATADDLPIGAAVCGANRQDAAFVAEALASVVVGLPVDLARVVAAAAAGDDDEGARRDRRRRGGDGRLTGKARRAVTARLSDAAADAVTDLRAMPFLRADGNFAKDPSRLPAREAGYRLWAPDKKAGQSRTGLGRVRSAVERAHAFLNQFGRVCRRLDRRAERYLWWVQLACCIVLMRRGFFP